MKVGREPGTARQVREHGRVDALPPDTVVIDTNPDLVDETLVTANLLTGAESFPREGTVGDLMLEDDVEAFGFSTGADSLDAFLLVYQRPGA